MLAGVKIQRKLEGKSNDVSKKYQVLRPSKESIRKLDEGHMIEI